MSAPAEPPVAPPAPPVALTALLARPELGLRLLAGPGEAEVQWVHASEMADPFPYLLGGELLLTAGVQLPDPGRYVRRVAEAGAAALGFGVTPVYDTVPEALVAACERYGLPLVEVPPGTPFTAVARAVWRLMARARTRELRRVTEAQQALAAAAARPDPVPAVLAALASRLGGRAALLDPDGTERAAAGRPVPPEAAAALARLVRVLRGERGGGPAAAPPGGASGPVSPAPASATDTVAGVHLAAYPLGGPGRTGQTGGGAGPLGRGAPPDPAGPPREAPYSLPGVLGLATPGREPGDHTVAGVAAVLLSLLTAPHQGADEATRSAALVRLLLGTAPADAAPLLGEGPWTVVHASGQGASGQGAPPPPGTPPPGAPPLGTPLLDAGPEGVRALLPAGTPVAPHPGWTLGVSAPAGPGELLAADRQAARALRRALATRVPLVRHTTGGLAALLDQEEAGAYARALLAPLPEPLRHTLRTWLSLHGNWDRTAAALELHRNTVRQRITRCATLLDRDLDDPETRMELWFALRQEP
ncbi:PucR family transcriptional regulator [Streptomyces sp. LP05-1]|uniref:PucR family transcriptional regulator n=1 Tax=Streptomyces pyxinae TaxID=2970734 RepID=A0ABT2CK50_9ACTN|nr:PucR family transcriptional regulator [Streptomyces sp. LP05-1]MCS0637793.1 PucR family transcriptional regulator [Streptomyces sp. LP05-1]